MGLYLIALSLVKRHCSMVEIKYFQPDFYCTLFPSPGHGCIHQHFSYPLVLLGVINHDSADTANTSFADERDGAIFLPAHGNEADYLAILVLVTSEQNIAIHA